MHRSTPNATARSGPGAPAIQTHQLSKAFGTQPVLRGVDLSVDWGECLVLFGPNGSGKTTLVRVLATLARHDAGTVHIASHDLERNPTAVRQALGVLTHQTLLYDHLTGAENLRFYGRMFRVPDLSDRIYELASALGIGLFLQRRVHTLSHGMQKRLSLARALLHRPRVLLLDEPETGLDPEALGVLERLLRDHREWGGAALITTHNVEQGLALADRVAILSSGRLAFQAPRAEVSPTEFRQLYGRVAGVPA